jgi:Tol biopolymer transport system component
MQKFGLFIVCSVLLSLLPACQPATDDQQEDVVQQPDPMSDYPMLPLERLMAPASFTVPQISPDGRLLSWIAPLDGTPNLYVAEVGDLDSARPVTRFTDSGVRGTDVSGQVMYRWHYDSKHILYPKDYGGDENWDIHIVNVETAEDRNLTPIPDKKVEVIAYGRAKPDEVLISVVTFGQRNPDVYHLNLQSGEKTLVQENEVHWPTSPTMI